MMRKISSKTAEVKKRKRNQLLIGGILIAVMCVSVFGIMINSFGQEDEENTGRIVYNGYEFVLQNNYWFLDLGDFDFIFKYNPLEIEEFGLSDSTTTELNLVNAYQNKPLYIYSEHPAATSEIYQNLVQFATRAQLACPEESLKKQGQGEGESQEDNCDENLPIKTCTDNFIIIRSADYSNIYQQENCVFIEGKSEDLVKLSDLFLFKIFKIKE